MPRSRVSLQLRWENRELVGGDVLRPQSYLHGNDYIRILL